MVTDKDDVAESVKGPDALVVPMHYSSNTGTQTLPAGMVLHAGGAFYGPKDGVVLEAGSQDTTVFVYVTTGGSLVDALQLEKGSFIAQVKLEPASTDR
jgi:hypothetical protein